VDKGVFFSPDLPAIGYRVAITDGLALGDEDLRLPEVTDDLLCGITLPGHNDPFLVTLIITLGMRTIQGGRSDLRKHFKVRGLELIEKGASSTGNGHVGQHVIADFATDDELLSIRVPERALSVPFGEAGVHGQHRQCGDAGLDSL